MANSELNELIEQKQQEADEYKEKADKAERELQELLDLEQKIQNMQSITPKAILNGEEREIFSVLLSLKSKQQLHYTICPQVAFSAFLRNDEKVDWYIYNKFYVDFLLVDKKTSKPFCVIEYYGLGHGKDDGEKTQKRDVIKKEVCKKAGIGFIELKAKQEVENFKDYVCATILAEIEKLNKQE